MMYIKTMIENPALRVFHIDHECYLIYLGTSHTDYRPFLRIGNSSALPEEIKSYVSSVLITDNYTGNPFLEHINLELPFSGETKFVGDPLRIERLKQFLHEKNLPQAEFEYETIEQSPEKGRSLVFFFKSGNLHVHHNGDELFNLRQREEQDLHGIYLTERVSSIVKANPLRYLLKTFQQPGFFYAGKKVYFFHEQRIGVFQTPNDYLFGLSRLGIDPDLLQWGIETDFQEGILRRLKRSIINKRELRLGSPNIEMLRSVLHLFSGMGASLFAAEPDPKGTIHLQGFRFRLEEGQVEFPINFTLPLGEEAERPENLLYSPLIKRGLPLGATLLEGVPYRFHISEPPLLSSVLSTYLLSFAQTGVEVSTEAQLEGWKGVVSALLQIQEQWKRTTPGLEALHLLKPALLQVLKNNHTLSSLFLWNLSETCRCLDPKGVDGKTKIHNFLYQIKKKSRDKDLFSFSSIKKGVLPIAGNVWVKADTLYLFYSLESLVTPLKLQQAEKTIEQIDKLESSLPKEDTFKQERERLLSFLESLQQTPPKRVKRPLQAKAPEEAPSEREAPSDKKSVSEKEGGLTGTSKEIPSKITVDEGKTPPDTKGKSSPQTESNLGTDQQKSSLSSLSSVPSSPSPSIGSTSEPGIEAKSVSSNLAKSASATNVTIRNRVVPFSSDKSRLRKGLFILLGVCLLGVVGVGVYKYVL
ncbi:MAG: hypothetical protein SNJ78_01705, partial [Spirochaetales bacterium]